MSSSTYNPVITLTSLSTQQGEINLVTNPIAQFDASNWTTSSATLTRSTTGVLSPVIPTGFTASSTTSTTSYVQTSLLTVPATLRNRKLKVQLYIQCADTATWKVDVLKSDGSTRYTLSTDSSGVSALPALTGTYTTTFDMDTGSGIYVRLTRYAGSGTSTLSFTNLIVGPGIQPQGAVAEEWKSFTPIPTENNVDRSSAFVILLGQYRRVGSSIEFNIRLKRSSSSIGSATNSFGLRCPTGTINLTALPMPSAGFYQPSVFIKTATTEGDGASIIATSVGSNTVLFEKQLGTVALYYNDTDLPINTDLEIYGSLPIAEWSGSGTVQLAQNDVEYASNSGNVTAAGGSDTTSFAYGPSGSPFLAYNSTTLNSVTSFTVQFQTPIQLGDQLTLEVSNNNGTQWFGIGNGNTGVIAPIVWAGTAIYGAGVTYSSPTTAIVQFGNYGRLPTGASYGAAGTTWASLAAGFRWRVRKSSAGAAVGFGIVQPGVSSGLVSASGLPGNTTGNAIASGFVGEVITFTGRSQAGGSAAWAVNTSAVCTLTVGQWLIIPTCVGTNAAAIQQAIGLSTSTTPGSGIISQTNMTTNTTLNIRTCGEVVNYIATTSTPLYLHVYNSTGTSTGSITGIALRIA